MFELSGGRPPISTKIEKSKVSVDSVQTTGNSMLLSRGGNSRAERSKFHQPSNLSNVYPSSSISQSTSINELFGPSKPFDQITKNLYIGDLNDAQNLEGLNRENITHIVNCTDIPNAFPNQKYYIRLGLKDDPTFGREDLFEVLEPSYRYIKAVIKRNPNAKILIHCRAGISRSASIAIYALMRLYGLDYKHSLEMVRAARPIVNPNPWYEKQLRDVESMLKTM